MLARLPKLTDITDILLLPDDRAARVNKLTSLAEALSEPSNPPSHADIAAASRLDAAYDEEALTSGASTSVTPCSSGPRARSTPCLAAHANFQENYSRVKTYEGLLLRQAAFAQDKNALGEGAGAAANGGATYEEQVGALAAPRALMRLRG